MTPPYKTYMYLKYILRRMGSGILRQRFFHLCVLTPSVPVFHFLRDPKRPASSTFVYCAFGR